MRKNRRKYKPSAMPVPGHARVVTRKITHRRIIDVSKTWYVVKTAGGNAERRACIELRGAGFDVYRPAEDRWRIFRWRCSDVSTGFFRGYCFVGCGHPARFDLIRGVEGVASILGTSGTPLSVPGELLQKVADELAGIKKVAVAPFKEGTKVSVRRGPFAELVGIIRELDHEGERALVKIDMLGKSHELELGYADLKVA